MGIFSIILFCSFVEFVSNNFTIILGLFWFKKERWKKPFIISGKLLRYLVICSSGFEKFILNSMNEKWEPRWFNRRRSGNVSGRPPTVLLKISLGGALPALGAGKGALGNSRKPGIDVANQGDRIPTNVRDGVGKPWTSDLTICH